MFPFNNPVGISRLGEVVAHTGLEPVISALRGQRVNQLHQCAAAGWNYRWRYLVLASVKQEQQAEHWSNHWSVIILTFLNCHLVLGLRYFVFARIAYFLVKRHANTKGQRPKTK